jgi:hypothetical protein
MMVIDSEQWTVENFGGCELGDERRTKRLVKIAKNMLAAPDKSLPTQNCEWSETKAAYRFFANESVTFERVGQLHWQQTRQTKPGRYLLICDTTDIDHYWRKATTGLGMLGDGKGRGLQLHSCLMYDCNEKQIHGIGGALVCYRKLRSKNETKMQRLNRERESDVWGKLVDQVGSAPDGSQWIHVWDRGGDNFEAMCHISLTGNDWVIRAAQSHRNVFTEDGRKMPLRDATREALLLGSYELNLRSRPGVAARTAKIEVSVVRVKYPRPSQHSKWVKGCGITELPMNVVIVQEVDAPKGVKPIRWVLLTSLSVKTFDDAWQVIEYYENRWLIEEYHKVMKTGCNLEVHALRDASRLEPLIALISIIGIRLFQLKLIGRNQPDAKAKSRVPSSWLRALKLARPKIKRDDMSVYQFFREIAKLGGFLGRKYDGEPGWQTIWRGYQKLQSILDAMKITGAS